MNHSKSSSLFSRALKSIPGGVNSPVRAFRSVELSPLFIEKANGSRVFDADGSEYIDYVGSWGPMILGHAHPDIVETLCKTAVQGLSFGAPTELEVLLAEKIKSFVPSMDQVRMVSSGTEATMSAIRVARGFTGRDKIIKFSGCYHGHADHLLVKAGSGATTLGSPDSPGVPKSFASETLIAKYNNLDEVKTLVMQFPDEIAAIILEPVAGNMGVISPQKGFLEGLRNICDEYGIVLIFDEVMTGFRVAKGGAQELFNIKPDMTTLGKIIGGGMPVGAYGGKQEIMNIVSPAGAVYQAGTLSGNPLAMAVGLKTLSLLEAEHFYPNLFQQTNKLVSGLETTFKSHQVPYRITQMGAMFGFFFIDRDVQCYEDALQCDTELFAKLFKGLIQEGIYIAPSAFEALFVSAAHSNDDIHKTLAAFDKSLALALKK